MHHLEGHYPSFIAPTSSCARPNSSARTSCFTLISSGLCRLLPAPAGKGSFPTLSLQVFPRMLGSRSRRGVGCTCLFLPLHHRPSPSPTDRSASRFCPLKDFTAVGVSRSSPFLTFRPPGLFATRVSPTAEARRPQGSCDFYTRAEHAPLPVRASGMLAVRTRQLTAEDLHLIRLAALSAAPRTFTYWSNVPCTAHLVQHSIN
jgi:hypothetical protein